MNINTIVKTALTSLAIPVYANVYIGPEEEYITLNYSDERPVLRADDVDITDMTTVQIHYFTKTNPLLKKKSIRNLMRLAGFTIMNTQELYESDTELYHIVVEAWIDGIVSDV